MSMRTIKFRGKRPNGKWIYGDLLTSNGTECEISDWNTVDYSRYDVAPETTGQFTGLYDKNGNEVYEGDIVKRKVVKSDYYPEQYMPHVKEHAETRIGIKHETSIISMRPEIRFGEEFITKMPKQEEDNGLLSSFDYEVIGNIFDNPELLKGGIE